MSCGGSCANATSPTTPAPIVKRRPTYREIDREEVPPSNPIDMAVHRRVGRRAVMRKLAMAHRRCRRLGRRRRLWFDYEEALGG